MRLGGLAAVAGPERARSSTGSPPRSHGSASTCALGTEATSPVDADAVVQCTGSVPGMREYEVDRRRRASSTSPTCAVARSTLPADGDVVVFDPIGGPIGVALAEELGGRAVLVTQDHIAGNELARTGDLAPANVRLAQALVRIERPHVAAPVVRDGGGRGRATGSAAPTASIPLRGGRRLRVPPAR